MVGERSLIRTQEMELGDLVADAFRWKTGADIAVMNSGGIRADLPAGNVTKGDTMSIFPFGNQLHVAEISGVKIREMLEHSVSIYSDTFGGFLQVSGIKFTFSPKKTAGERVGEIFINGAPIIDDKIYTLATMDFTLSGGDGYDILKKLSVTAKYGTGEEILADYLHEVDTTKIVTGRIIRQ